MIYRVLSGYFDTLSGIIKQQYFNVLRPESRFHIKGVSIIEVSFICNNNLQSDVNSVKNLCSKQSCCLSLIQYLMISCQMKDMWPSESLEILQCKLPLNIIRFKGNLNVMHCARTWFKQCFHCHNQPMTKTGMDAKCHIYQKRRPTER